MDKASMNVMTDYINRIPKDIKISRTDLRLLVTALDCLISNYDYDKKDFPGIQSREDIERVYIDIVTAAL